MTSSLSMTSYQEKLIILFVPGAKSGTLTDFYQGFRIAELNESWLFYFWRKSKLIKYSKWQTEICKMRLFFFCEMCQFRSDLKTKYISVISMAVWFQNTYFLCVWVSITVLKNPLPVRTKTSMSLDLTNRYRWNSMFKIIEIYFNM